MSFQGPATTGGAFLPLAGTPMAGVKITSLIANTAERVEAQQRDERDDDAKAIIEVIEEELENIRRDVETLQARVQQLEQQGGVDPEISG